MQETPALFQQPIDILPAARLDVVSDQFDDVQLPERQSDDRFRQISGAHFALLWLWFRHGLYIAQNA
jgi:hypothetical protein